MPDYSKSIIYTIRSKDNIYVGSTLNFRARKCQHKTCINNENSPKYNVKLYKTIRQNAGEWDMKAHSIFPCNSKMELTIEEERIRQLLNADMNSNSCGTGLTGPEYKKQYYDQYKDKYTEYKKQWYEQNRDEHKEKMNQYYYQHKDEYNENKKQYYEQHRDEIREKRRQRVTCECGCDVAKYCLSRHRKTTKHILLMEKLNQ